MTTDSKERRYINADELRFEDGDGGPRIHGYAAVFNSPSEDLGGFREIIVPGAFTRALGGGNVPLLIEHDGLPLADTRTGSLSLTQDGHGLAIEARLDPTDPDVQRVLPKLRLGTLRSMSFGFSIPRGGDKWAKNGTKVVRSITDIKRLYDVSVVTTPAYPETSVALRSMEAWQQAEQHTPAPQREHRRRKLLLADT